MLVDFKYSLGDTFVCEETGKTYEIKEWHVKVDETGITVEYSFHAYLDDCFGYHDFVEESMLEKGLLSTQYGFKFDDEDDGIFAYWADPEFIDTCHLSEEIVDDEQDYIIKEGRNAIVLSNNTDKPVHCSISFAAYKKE